MECPRCAEPLERYALQGREAFVCEACGYIGVPVEHRGEYDPPESWDDAISRFHDVARVESATVETSDEDPTPEFIDGDGDESGDDGDGGDSDGSLEPAFVRVGNGNGVGDGAGDGDGNGRENREANDSTDGDFSCAVCGETFDSRAALNGHSATHADGEKEA
jgi:hypothetical protein